MKTNKHTKKLGSNTYTRQNRFYNKGSNRRKKGPSYTSRYLSEEMPNTQKDV